MGFKSRPVKRVLTNEQSAEVSKLHNLMAKLDCAIEFYEDYLIKSHAWDNGPHPDHNDPVLVGMKEKRDALADRIRRIEYV